MSVLHTKGFIDDCMSSHGGLFWLRLARRSQHVCHAKTVIKAVMHSPLRMSDPHATTAYISTWHGYMIYDTLLAIDAQNQIRPQMMESWQVSDDGKTYTMTLRRFEMA